MTEVSRNLTIEYGLGRPLHHIVDRWRKNSASKAIAEKKEKIEKKQGGVKIADIAEDYDHYFILYVSRKNVKHGVDQNEQKKFCMLLDVFTNASIQIRISYVK